MIESLQKQADKENLSKNMNRGLFDYYDIVSKEAKQKIRRSNSWFVLRHIFFYIKFYVGRKFQIPSFSKFTGVLGNIEYDTLVLHGANCHI